MSLKQIIEQEMKAAMKAQDKGTLEALRGIKSLVLLAETKEGGTGSLTEAEEVQLLSKAAKQRRESADIFTAQNRPDLAAVELSQLAVIERFLPKQLSEEELRAKLDEIVQRLGASGPKDMGKVMGVATKELAGQADGKLVSAIVKSILS